jgi:putative hydrolase of the HAD superfamily
MRPNRMPAANGSGPQPTHVLLDFFGTLVAVAPEPEDRRYPEAYRLARELGANVGSQAFLQIWAEEFGRLEDHAAADNGEFSLDEVAVAVLARLLPRHPQPAEVSALAAAFLAEWNTGVSYPADTAATVRALASRYTLAVVSNTLDRGLVPAHLRAMGIAGHFETVVLSVEVGWRKPHPAIYAEALRRLRTDPASAVFAGDTYEADYAGPVRSGLTAFLIDPSGRHDIPASHRLRTLADLPARLGL